MSVEAYLKKVEDGAKSAIQKNAEYIASHPYPKDLLAEVVKPLGDKSVLNKIFGPSGRKKSLGSFTPDEIIAAKEEANVYPTLWGDLTSGNTSLILEEKNSIINNSNHENELKNAYSQFREKIPVEQKVVGSSEFTINYIFKNLPDKDFLDELALQTDFDFNLNTYGADDLVKAAFMELYEKDTGAKTTSSTASTSKPSESSKSPVNSTASQSTSTEEKPASSINSTTIDQNKSASVSSNPINPTSTKSSEPTAVTSLDGGVTSKVGEIQTENILDTNPSQAININLENKPIESKPAVEPTSNSTTATTTSNSTTVNDVNSASSVTSNPSNTSNNTGVTGDKNIMKVENTNNQSSSSTVNENKPEKQKSGFLSKVGNFAKKAGAALNLPSIGELGEQAKGLFGATGANISSRISEVKESFAINSNKNELNSSPTSSTETNSVNSSAATNNKPDILAVPNTSAASNTENLLKTETQNSMNVEQKLPGVTATSSTPAANTQAASIASTAVSNTSNSQTASSPQSMTTNTAQNTQTNGQPASSPPGMGVNVDINQLAQSIMRLERILINGIDVTIKDT